MSNRPLHEFKGKGVRVTIWAGKNGPTATLEKYWKNRETGEYERKKISLWQSELEELAGLMRQAVAAIIEMETPEEPLPFTAPGAPSPSINFQDEDIPF